MGTSRDPLGAFFASLDKVAAYGPQVKVALPAHGHPFADLAGRAEDIKVHLERQDNLEVLEVKIELPDGAAAAGAR